MDLLLAKQEAGQVVSTKDALVADVLLEGTASATGRLPVKQATRSDVIQPAPVSKSSPVEKPTTDQFATPADKSTTMEKSSAIERSPREARVPAEEERR